MVILSPLSFPTPGSCNKIKCPNALAFLEAPQCSQISVQLRIFRLETFEGSPGFHHSVLTPPFLLQAAWDGSWLPPRPPTQAVSEPRHPASRQPPLLPKNLALHAGLCSGYSGVLFHLCFLSFLGVSAASLHLPPQRSVPN